MPIKACIAAKNQSGVYTGFTGSASELICVYKRVETRQCLTRKVRELTPVFAQELLWVQFAKRARKVFCRQDNQRLRRL